MTSGGARDFPFQPGQSPAPPLRLWVAALGLTALGVAGLMASPRLFGAGQSWLGVLIFVGAPLTGLALLLSGRLDRVFARPTGRDLLLGVGFGLLNLVVTIGVGLLVSQVLRMAANPVNATLAALPDSGLPAFFALTALQLVGEELVTAIPFLAVLTLAGRLGLGRRATLVVASLVAALAFAAMHFPTYQWHVVQTILIIGSARLVLLGAWLTTKNLWASVIAHILNDWTLFAVALLLMRAAG